MQIAGLAKDVDIIKEPVKEVAASRYDIGYLEEGLGIALMDDLNAFEFKERLENSKQLSSLSDSFWYQKVIHRNFSILLKIVPALKFREVLEEFNHFVSSLYDSKLELAQLYSTDLIVAVCWVTYRRWMLVKHRSQLVIVVVY